MTATETRVPAADLDAMLAVSPRYICEVTELHEDHEEPCESPAEWRVHVRYRVCGDLETALLCEYCKWRCERGCLTCTEHVDSGSVLLHAERIGGSR